MPNFLITAMGRSGTRFLAEIMNRSKSWKVKHEPGPPIIPADHELKRIQNRFNNETKEHTNYGEINSLLRYMADQLKVDNKGIIIRDPVEVWISLANRKHSKTWLSVLIDYETTIEEFKRLINTGMPAIDFHKMTTDRRYLSTVFKFYGINDVQINDNLMKTKVNKTEKFYYKSLSQFEDYIQNRILRLKDILDFSDSNLA